MVFTATDEQETDKIRMNIDLLSTFFGQKNQIAHPWKPTTYVKCD